MLDFCECDVEFVKLVVVCFVDLWCLVCWFDE